MEFRGLLFRSRVKALIRRRKMSGANILELGNVKIDMDNRTASVEDNLLDLNRKEFDILLYLATNKERLVSKSALAEHVWGDYIDQTDNFEFIYSQIKNLRRKLKSSGADLEIKAVYGIGYKLFAE